MSTRTDAALIMHNPDVIEMVAFFLGMYNLQARGLELFSPQETIENWIADYDSAAVVFDLAPPYKRSTAVARDLVHRFSDRLFIFTCADPVLAVRDAEWLQDYPLFQKPYEPLDLVGLIRSQVAALAASKQAARFPAVSISRRPLEVSASRGATSDRIFPGAPAASSRCTGRPAGRSECR